MPPTRNNGAGSSDITPDAGKLLSLCDIHHLLANRDAPRWVELVVKSEQPNAKKFRGEIQVTNSQLAHDAPGCGVGQTVRFHVVLPPHMGDGKLQPASQLAADPVQRIQTWAAAGVLAHHLFHNHL
jgi:hypothetical protein